MLLSILLSAVACAAPFDRASSTPKPRPPEGGIAGSSCTCTGDLDGNTFVDAADLSILLGQWGIWGSADLNGNFIVDAADLSILLGA